MPEKTEYTVRNAKREDMVEVLTLVQAHGWNNILEHLNLQFDCFPDGVFVAESAEGEIISHCAAMPLDDSNGIIAYYITKENWRGKGIGRKVFDQCYKALGNKNIGLNGAEDGQSMYAARGFNISTFWLQTYFCPIKHLKSGFHKMKSLGERVVEVLPIEKISKERIFEYDQKIHPIGRVRREELLNWYIDAAYAGFVAVDEDGKVIGWGLLYRSYIAYCLMPLYADTQHTARILLNCLLRTVQGDSEGEIELIFPTDNVEAGALFEEFGFSAGRKEFDRRMFTKHNVPIKTNLVYSILNSDTGLI